MGLDTVAEAVQAGAEILAAGSAVFGQGDPKANVQRLLKVVRETSLQKV